MPLYEYCCGSCGEFEAWRTIAQRDRPLYCPNCNEVARRIFSPPMVNLNSGSFNKLSQNPEPKLVRRDKEPQTPKIQNAKARPWMIGH